VPLRHDGDTTVCRARSYVANGDGYFSVVDTVIDPNALCRFDITHGLFLLEQLVNRSP
jgi:hypothetical protein